MAYIKYLGAPIYHPETKERIGTILGENDFSVRMELTDVQEPYEVWEEKCFLIPMKDGWTLP